MDVHLRDLRYFVVVAEELHFTRAAERLFVSQPALSKQIRQLEQALRVTLFDRDKRSVSLTGPGAALLAQAQHLLAVWDGAQQQVAEAAAAAAAELLVGFSTSVGRDLLPNISRRFAERRPTWRLSLRQVSWADPTAGVGGGSCDVALVWLPTGADDTVAHRVLVTEPRWVALPLGHRLVSEEVVDFGELLQEPFVALPRSAGVLRDYWLAVEARGGSPARIATEASTADDALEAVAAGQGVALLSAGNAALYARRDIVSRPVAGISPAELAVIWRADDHRGAVRDFIDCCAG